MAEEEEDDYLTMSFEDPKSTKASAAPKETSLQRTARLKRERAEKARIPSKKEREEAAAEAREKALATSMFENENASKSIGAKMMAKMGYKAGEALGKTEDARTRPIEVQMKDDRGGIGMENEKKRKIREAMGEREEGEKRARLTAEEYRERNMREREEKRAEGQWWSAMRLLEGFEEDKEKEGGEEEKTKKPQRPLRSIPVLYRPLVKSRLEKDREKRMRSELQQSLSRSRAAEYDEDSDGQDDGKVASETALEEDLDEEDPELSELETMPFSERLEKILQYLREKYNYCFWCKCSYEDQEMEGCPGLTEDQHG